AATTRRLAAMSTAAARGDRLVMNRRVRVPLRVPVLGTTRTSTCWTDRQRRDARADESSSRSTDAPMVSRYTHAESSPELLYRDMMTRFLGPVIMQAFDDPDVTEVYTNPQDRRIWMIRCAGQRV